MVAGARCVELSIAEVAVDIWVAEETVHRWENQRTSKTGCQTAMRPLSRTRSCSCADFRGSWRWRAKCCPARQPNSRRQPIHVPCPLVSDPAAEGFPVRVACGVLGFSTQASYAWLKDVPQLKEFVDRLSFTMRETRCNSTVGASGSLSSGPGIGWRSWSTPRRRPAESRRPAVNSGRVGRCSSDAVADMRTRAPGAKRLLEQAAS